MPPLYKVGVHVPGDRPLHLTVDVVPRLPRTARLFGHRRNVAVLEVALEESVGVSVDKKGSRTQQGVWTPPTNVTSSGCWEVPTLLAHLVRSLTELGNGNWKLETGNQLRCKTIRNGVPRTFDLFRHGRTV
jgi:hypothetical protein